MASRARLYASASNVANWQSRGAVPATPPSQPIGGSGTGPRVYQAVTTVQTPAGNGGGVIASQQPVLPSYIQEYDPDAPYANAQGLVAAPNVDLAVEAVNQIVARHALKANIATIKTADEMEKSLLDVFA
jgi:flagellar basal-body rod protein FlgC